MNREEQTKTVMIILNWKKPFRLEGFNKKFSASRVEQSGSLIHVLHAESDDNYTFSHTDIIE